MSFYEEVFPDIPQEILWGDDLVWQDRVGFARIPGTRYYLVTTEGDVISLKRECPDYVTSWTTKAGYSYVDLREDGKRHHCYVHRLVAEAFLPNPMNLPFVRHLNDIKSDNRLCNLAWGTAQDNHDDMIRNNTEYDNRVGVYCFEKNKHYKSCREAARDLGVSPSLITLCCNGKCSHANFNHLCYECDYEEKSKDTSWMTIKNGYKPLIAIDPNGNRHQFESRIATAEALGIPVCGISSVIHGTIKHTHGWKFEEG